MSAKHIIPLAKELHDSWPTLDPTVDPRQALDWSLHNYQMIVNRQYQLQPNAIHPRVVPSYDRFILELGDQFDAMRKAGVRVEWADDDPTPVDPKTGTISHRLFVEAYRKTGILRVFRSPDDDHPLLSARGWYWPDPDDPRIVRSENMNSIFRAVHDFYGHLASGGGFGWKGETTAYYSHAQMFSVEARRALFCETVAQQCVYAITHDYATQKCVWYDEAFFYPPLS